MGFFNKLKETIGETVAPFKAVADATATGKEKTKNGTQMEDFLGLGLIRSDLFPDAKKWYSFGFDPDKWCVQVCEQIPGMLSSKYMRIAEVSLSDLVEFQAVERREGGRAPSDFSYTYEFSTSSGERYRFYQSYKHATSELPLNLREERESVAGLSFVLTNVVPKIQGDADKKWANTVFAEIGAGDLFAEDGMHSLEAEKAISDRLLDKAAALDERIRVASKM